MTDTPQPGSTTHGLIDVWAQPAVKHLFQRVPEIERLFAQSGAASLLATGVSPDEMVRAMDRAGITTVLLSAWHRPGSWVMTNDEVAEIVQAYPGRFAGVAAVNLERPIPAVRELERAVRELGFKALRVIPWLWNRPPNDKLYYPLYVKCIELGVPFYYRSAILAPCVLPSQGGRFPISTKSLLGRFQN